MSVEPRKVGRRSFIYAGLGAVALIAIGAAAYFATRPPAVVTQTTTVPTTTVVTQPTTTVVTTTIPTITTVTQPTTTITTVTTTASLAQKVLLKAWYLTDPGRNEYYAAMANEFNKIDPEVSIEFEFPGRYEEYLVKVSTAVATGTEPDIIYMWFGDEWTNYYASKGVIMPLPVEEYKIEEKLVPGILELSKYEGKVYMVPTNMGAAFLYYNERMVNEVGYNWETLQSISIEEFSSMCEKLKAKGYTPFIHNHETMNNTIIMLTLMLGNALGREKYLNLFQSWKKEAKMIEKWTQPEVVKVFDILYDWLKKGYFLPGINAIDATTCDKNFAAEKAAMYHAYISRVVVYLKTPELKFNTAPSPIINKSEPSKIQVHTTGYTISRKCKSFNGAMRFLNFLCEEKAGVEATKVGLLTPVKKAFTPENYKQYMPYYQTPLNKYSEGVKGTVPRGDYFMSPEVNSEVHKALAKFFDLTVTPSDLCNELESIFEKFRKG
ncbi:MAG: extracellular solute-binding protein [Nitrososphaeria archaeon]